jgi:UDP-glucose 4-epimerase
LRGRSVLVTGGAGFIGSHVAEALVAAGHRVLVVDDLSSGRRENVPEGAELHVLDVRSELAARLLVEAGVEVLVHHAAQMDVRRSVADPRFDADVNIGGLLNLLEAARRGRVRQVVLASTGGAIYGEQEAFPAGEDHPVRPLSPYGVAKLASERYLYFYHAEYALNVTCLRYANVYGPRQNPHGEAGVVAIFNYRILSGEQPRVNGDGLQTRDYTFVGDVVRANLAAVGRRGFEVYNVGTGVETDVNTLYQAIRTALGEGPEPDHGPPAAGEQRRSSISPARLERELGVRVATTLAEGLVETAAWFRAEHARQR